MQLHDTLPSFSFKATNGLEDNFENYRGKWIVLYFYPKDSTPGCTLEGNQFREYHEQFTELNTVVFGVSRDDMQCHEKFKEKHQYPFELITDPDEKLCQLFDVIKEKKFFGKTIRGIVRSTFLIDPEGKIRHIWPKVSVFGHAKHVLETLIQLQKST